MKRSGAFLCGAAFSLVALVGLSGCTWLQSLGSSSTASVTLATCSDATAAITMATPLKAAGKLTLAQEQVVDASIAQLQPVCGSATPQTVLTAAETVALNNMTAISGSSTQ